MTGVPGARFGNPGATVDTILVPPYNASMPALNRRRFLIAVPLFVLLLAGAAVVLCIIWYAQKKHARALVLSFYSLRVQTMGAEIRFFCSASEEADVLRYLMEQAETRVFRVYQNQLKPWKNFLIERLPRWPRPLELYLWWPIHGTLIWHTSPPPVAGPTHGSLVMNLIAREEWEAAGLGEGDRMIDLDLSPVLYYRRALVRGARIGPCTLTAPPSSLCRVGPEYERVVKRIWAWIRRHSKNVHDWRKRNPNLPNPNGIVSTIYAFPDAHRILRSQNHKFAILFH
jgi:hypothetical protein